MLGKDELTTSLQDLGINQDNYRVLSLLPMVLVAWSDGKIQRAERNRIVEIAKTNGFLGGGGEAILDKWLKDKPLDAYFDLGFKALIELARKERGLGSDMNSQSLKELEALSFEVASAAGGLFGQAWSVSPDERKALNSLAGILSIDDGQSWGELLEDLK